MPVAFGLGFQNNFHLVSVNRPHPWEPGVKAPCAPVFPLLCGPRGLGMLVSTSWACILNQGWGSRLQESHVFLKEFEVRDESAVQSFRALAWSMLLPLG